MIRRNARSEAMKNSDNRSVRSCEEIEIFAKSNDDRSSSESVCNWRRTRGETPENFDEAAADLYRPDLDPFIGPI